MRSKPVKAPVIKKMGSFLHARLQKEIESSRKNISGLKKSIRGLQNKDRRLHRYGTRLVRKIDGRLAVNRKSIEDAENRLKSKEKKYSNLKARDFALQKTLVCLSGAEIKDLKKMSGSYRAFERYVSAAAKKPSVKYQGICPWNACWTCTDSCGGCTGCGQACSQINNCVARPAK